MERNHFIQALKLEGQLLLKICYTCRSNKYESREV